MNHIPVNLTNIAIITLSAGLGLWASAYILVFLGQRNIPLLSPLANALLSIVDYAAKTPSGSSSSNQGS